MSEDINERFHVNTCLAQHAPQGSHCQITPMERHNACDAGIATFRVEGLSSQYNMAAFLAHDLETEAS
jgi:hypothetical protein